MRKLFLVAGLLLALGVLTAGIALAAPHGPYKVTQTEKCAECHRAHTASQTYLLYGGTNEYEFCLTCHGDSHGSSNVQSGISSSGQPLNGGGFERVRYDPTGVFANDYLTATLSLSNTTSLHQVWGAPRREISGTVGIGNYDYDSASVSAYGEGAVSGQLKCSSCHNPHGSTNYRLLRDSENGQGLALFSGAADFEDNKPQKPTSSSSKTAGMTTYYSAADMSAWCAKCHRGYDQATGTQTVSGTDGDWNYDPSAPENATGSLERMRHAVNQASTISNPGGGEKSPTNKMRLAYVSGWSGTDSKISCLTCHFAHGSDSQASFEIPHGGTTDTFMATGMAKGSALLFWDERGVCANCHQKGKRLDASGAYTDTWGLMTPVRKGQNP